MAKTRRRNSLNVPGNAPALGYGALLVATLFVAKNVQAKDSDAVVLPVVTPVAECVVCPALHKPDPEAERELSVLAQQLDCVVVGAAEDLGLTVDVSARPDPKLSSPSEAALVEEAKTRWVFSPRIAMDHTNLTVRIVAVPPDGSVLFVRGEDVKPTELEVRTVLMMRDLVRAAGAPAQAAAPLPPRADEGTVVHETRSPGRAVLALNAAAFGGYVGYSLQRAGGSSDPRLTYPLIALGTGIGLGGSMILADEWDVSIGDAWYLSAGIWWPVFGSLLVMRHEDADRRFLYGATAGAIGLGLATTALTFGDMSEGGALMTHSGGAFGTMLGGVADLIVHGQTDVSPTRGLGIGAMSGVVLMGALARFTPPQAPSRVLLIDLGAGLGALTGAAVASPLVFGDNVGPTRNRLWLSSIALGTFVGAGIGVFTTSSVRETQSARSMPSLVPMMGVIDAVTKPDGTSTPVTGAGVAGTW